MNPSAPPSYPYMYILTLMRRLYSNTDVLTVLITYGKLMQEDTLTLLAKHYDGAS